jgi:hypothetical protein
MPQAPSGWYPDPDFADHLRYWNGTGFTQHRQRVATATVPPAEPRHQADAPRHRAAEPRATAAATGRHWLILGGLVGVLILAAVVRAL